MEPFKNLLNAAAVAHTAACLARADARFDAAGFAAQARQGLEALEFKARADHIADALARAMPEDFDRAAGLVERVLATPKPVDAVGLTDAQAEGLAGWILWPVGTWVARAGLTQPERALAVLHAITQRFTAEFAIRPFIQQHPGLVFGTLARWVHDPSAHVRRLVSEGTRPRLPWGQRLQALVADPSPSLPLLAALQDDATGYVRRSVANHLNDIAKDHPDLLVDWVRRHQASGGAPRQALLRHASRSLIKQGHADMLALWGLGRPFRGEVAFDLSPAQATVGGALALHLVLRSTARQAQALEIDYLVHHVKANGSTSPKVFKGWRLALAAGESRRLQKRHSLRPVTTRRYFAGTHRVEVQVNGRVLAGADFQLALA